MLGFGCVHPQGEAEDYDGLFFKQSELSQLARDLVGKPLCIEHMDKEPAGRVCHAWVGASRPEVYAIFETKSDFHGFLAKNLVQGGICQDLSLGHDVTIGESVLKKTPTEVSICERGARPNTPICLVYTSPSPRDS